MQYASWNPSQEHLIHWCSFQYRFDKSESANPREPFVMPYILSPFNFCHKPYPVSYIIMYGLESKSKIFKTIIKWENSEGKSLMSIVSFIEGATNSSQSQFMLIAFHSCGKAKGSENRRKCSCVTNRSIEENEDVINK